MFSHSVRFLSHKKNMSDIKKILVVFIAGFGLGLLLDATGLYRFRGFGTAPSTSRYDYQEDAIRMAQLKNQLLWSARNPSKEQFGQGIPISKEQSNETNPILQEGSDVMICGRRMLKKAMIFRVLCLIIATCLYFIRFQLQLPISESVEERQIKVTMTVYTHDNYTIKEPVIYCIMPTYARFVQKAELTRQCSTFRNVRNLVWILVEDSVEKTDLVDSFLKTCPVKTVHLNATMSELVQHGHRGVDQRNAGIAWTRTHLMSDDTDNKNGVVYFSDDDNTYDPRIFDEMRATNNVSVWPVGLVANIAAERPIVVNGTVVDFYTSFDAGRKFKVDMAGFAINAKFLLRTPCPVFKHTFPSGHLEDSFLKSLNITVNQLEPKAKNCSEILVWHTKTNGPQVWDAKQPLAKYQNKTHLIV